MKLLYAIGWLLWFIWGFILFGVGVTYIYLIISGIYLIPLYSIILDLILFLGIIILSIIKKDLLYFKRFTFFLILLYIGNSTYILLKGYLVDDSSVNLNSIKSVFDNSLNELIPITLLVLTPIISYLLCIFREEIK